LVNHATFRQLRNGRFLPHLVTKCISVSRRGIRKDIFENFHFRGQLFAKSVKQAPHSEQTTGHGMHCRDILFTPRCSPRARELPRSVNFSVWRTVAELRGVKVAQFSDFGLFSTYEIPKTYLPVTSLQPRGYITECFWFFHVVDEGPNGCLSGSGVFLRLLVGLLGTPQTCPNFRLRQMAISVTECNCTARHIWTKDVWKRAFLRRMYFPTKYLRPYPQNHPKTPFRGPLNAKPIIQIDLRKSHVNGAMKVKLYSYTGISKYLGCVKMFPLGGVQGVQGPLM